MAIDGAMGLPGIGRAQPASPAMPATRAGRVAAPGPTFAEILQGSIREVTALQTQADAAIRELALGRTADVSAVVNQVEKADLAFRTLLAIRDKLIDAYEEIHRLRM
jgi:flagellar hook-basal body complex protein FliE